MKATYISRRGVYYELSKSPYEYRSPYGDFFKFSSKKKLEIYIRKIEEFKIALEKTLNKFDYLGEVWINNARDISTKVYYKKLYKEVEK